jgi:putative addiction module killer protein
MYPIGYRMTLMNYLIQKTEEFDNWLLKLRDRRAKAKIIIRLQRVQEGNFGDHKSVGGGVSELRITEGAGYRLYYTIQGDVIVIMLAGGDKSTQQQDIEKAKQLKDNLDHD